MSFSYMYIYIYTYLSSEGSEDPSEIFFGPILGQKNWGKKIGIIHVRPRPQHSARPGMRERGQAWMDIQQLTPHLARLGAREVTRAVFLAGLAKELGAGRELFPSRQVPTQ